MNIIKSVLRLMSAVALTTVSTSSFIACDNQAHLLRVIIKISKKIY